MSLSVMNKKSSEYKEYVAALFKRVEDATTYGMLVGVQKDVQNDADLSLEDRADLLQLIQEMINAVKEDYNNSKNKTKVIQKDFKVEEIDKVVKLAKHEKKHKLEVKDASEIYNVPKHFILLFDDKPYIVKEGMLWKLKDHGFRSVETEITKLEENGGYEAICRIYPNLKNEDYKLLEKVAEMKDIDTFNATFKELMRPTTAHSTANDKNLKENQKRYPKEMAETRAVLRAARIYTGCGLSTPEEDSESE